jgi:hypothetical protein
VANTNGDARQDDFQSGKRLQDPENHVAEFACKTVALGKRTATERKLLTREAEHEIDRANEDMQNIMRTKPRKPGLSTAEQCDESRTWMRITQAMRDSGKYTCSKCGRGFVLGAAERVNPSSNRRVPVHRPKKEKP